MISWHYIAFQEHGKTLQNLFGELAPHRGHSRSIAPAKGYERKINLTRVDIWLEYDRQAFPRAAMADEPTVKSLAEPNSRRWV